MEERLTLWAVRLVERARGIREDEGQALVEYALILALIAVVSIGSNSVTFIDTRTNAVKHVTYVGRWGRNLQRERNINQLLPGTLQANPGVNIAALRPYLGYGAIRPFEASGTRQAPIPGAKLSSAYARVVRRTP